MEINSLRGNLWMITDIVLFLWNRHRRRILFFSRNVPFLLLFFSWHFMIHCRPHVDDEVSLFLIFLVFLFAMVSIAVDIRWFFCPVLRVSKWWEFQKKCGQTAVMLKPVLFVTQPKLRIMCLHVLRQMWWQSMLSHFWRMCCVCGKVLCMCRRVLDFLDCARCVCLSICVWCVCLFVLRVQHACACGADIGVGKRRWSNGPCWWFVCQG